MPKNGGVDIAILAELMEQCFKDVEPLTAFNLIRIQLCEDCLCSEICLGHWQMVSVARVQLTYGLMGS